MSKQSEAKKRQNYTPTPIVQRCRICKNLDLRIKDKVSYGRIYKDESLFCNIGGFAVKANGTCDEFKQKSV